MRRISETLITQFDRGLIADSSKRPQDCLLVHFEVNVGSQQMADTQEEGEENAVEFLDMEDAPLKRSHIDDRKIVERVLEAVLQARLDLPLLKAELRDAELDSSVDRRALGLLSISRW